MGIDGLQHVAEHLETTAKSTPQHSDAYARSAFNRLYYCMYLDVREMLGELDLQPNVTHQGLPDYLRGKGVVRHFQDACKKAKLSDSQWQRAKVYLNLLADDLIVAYRVRIVADYEPLELVVSESSGFSLAGTSFSDFKKRRGTVGKITTKVRMLWFQIQS